MRSTVKKYLIDTNIVLRFLLDDVKEQTQKARHYFQEAKANKIALILLPVTIFEIDYALVKLYKLPKQAVVASLESILSMDYIEVVDKTPLLNALKIYNRKAIDLVDAYLYSVSEEYGIEVLSFDRDFQKIKN